MKKEDFKLIIIVIGIMFILQGFLFISMINAFPEQKFTLYITILTVIPSIALILATLLYVKTSHEILEENQLMRKRKYVEEIIKKILLPINDRLKTEISSLKSIYTFHIEDLKSTKISDNYNIKKRVFLYYPEIYYKLLREYYNELYKEIEIHDNNKLPKFQKIYNDLINKIKTNSFKQKWEKKFNEYKPIAETGMTFSKTIDGIIESILHGKKARLPNLFWEKYKDEIFIDREKHKKNIDYFNEKREEIKNIAEKIKKDLVNKITEDLKTYGIIPTKVHFDYP